MSAASSPSFVADGSLPSIFGTAYSITPSHAPSIFVLLRVLPFRFSVFVSCRTRGGRGSGAGADEISKVLVAEHQIATFLLFFFRSFALGHGLRRADLRHFRESVERAPPTLVHPRRARGRRATICPAPGGGRAAGRPYVRP
eukprot:7185157-Prymnesium_polylepis.1